MLVKRILICKLLLLKTTNSETYPTVTLAALVSKVSKIENY